MGELLVAGRVHVIKKLIAYQPMMAFSLDRAYPAHAI